MIKSIKKFFLHYGDLTDTNSINTLIKNILPDEIYNLAAQSHVGISFKMPEYTTDVNSLGTLRILETIRSLGLEKKQNFIKHQLQNYMEKYKKRNNLKKLNFILKVLMLHPSYFHIGLLKNYRESYNIFASNGILFNHESPRRGETFVTRKITMGLGKIIQGKEKCIYLGNIYAKRDWGHAKDYVEMCWKILQHKKPDDFVVATEKQYSVKFFVEKCFEFLNIKIKWHGKGLNEIAKIVSFNKDKFPNIKKNQTVIRISKTYFRPNEVENLIGNTSKVKRIFKWKPKIQIKDLIKEMLESDLMIK